MIKYLIYFQTRSRYNNPFTVVIIYILSVQYSKVFRHSLELLSRDLEISEYRFYFRLDFKVQRFSYLSLRDEKYCVRKGGKSSRNIQLAQLKTQ